MLTNQTMFDLLKHYSSNENEIQIDKANLKQLFTDYRMANLSEEKCQQLIDTFGTAGHLTDGQFFKMLADKTASQPFNKAHLTVYQEMTHPMTHYYISSSHNTYLTGRQFLDKSSVGMYTKVLKDGYRCIEIDVWRKAFLTDQKNVVKHGYAFTTELPLKSVLKEIAKSAFSNSDLDPTSNYPVIISIENHLNKDGQKSMAQDMRTILGEFLDTAPVSGNIFPSPEEKRKKIFIKATIGQMEDTEKRGDVFATMKIPILSTETPTTAKQGEYTRDSSTQDPGTSRESETEPEVTESGWFDLKQCFPFIKEKPKLHPDFAQLVTYFAAKKAKKFKDVEKFYHMISHSEKHSNKKIDGNIDGYRKFTFKNMVRVYPNSLDIFSANYNPLLHWSAGAQMVALNCQTVDINLLINKAHFALNGNCGWVLKPAHLRQSGLVKPGSLCITILFANLDVDSAKTIISPKLKVSICGYEPGKEMKPKSTKEVESLNPIWSETISLQTAHPELLFIQFKVLSGVELMAQYTVSNRGLQRGFSCIHLETGEGKEIPNAKLFVFVSDNDIPETSI